MAVGSIPHPSEVYARLLQPKGCGFPLWNPDPDVNLPKKYRDVGVSIGDVGIITPDGKFDFLFNICLPPEHQINKRGVPDGFENVWTSIETLRRPNCHTRESVVMNNVSLDRPADGGFHFTSDKSEGAVLVLPDGGFREDLRNPKIFTEQARKHGTSWYKHANVIRPQMVKNDSLYLVTGCTKTASWGTASFSNNALRGGVSLTFTHDDAGSASYKWEIPDSVSVTCRQHNTEQALGENQCVFISGFHVTLRTGPFAALKGRVSLSLLPDNEPSAGNVSRASSGGFISFVNSGWPSDKKQRTGEREKKQRMAELKVSVDNTKVLEDRQAVESPKAEVDEMRRAEVQTTKEQDGVLKVLDAKQ